MVSSFGHLLMRRRLSLGLICASTLLMSVNAQTAFASTNIAKAPVGTQSGANAQVAASTASIPTLLHEVVVTAQRRQENLETVPLSVAALSGRDVAEGLVSRPSNLQDLVPGLVMRGEASNDQFNFAIRGQSVDAFTNSRPGVLQYINEFQTTAVGNGAYYDVQSIQVLKGPQGTLFGDNTTGGAVLVTTAKPTDHFGGFVTVGVGNYQHQDVHAAINLPFSKTLQVRVAGVEVQHRGYVRNLLRGYGLSNSSYLDNENFQSGRITVAFEPSDSVKSLTTAEYDRSRNSGPGLILYSLYPCAPNAPPAGVYLSCYWSPAFPGWNAYLAAHPGVPAGGIEQSFAIQQKIGPYKIYADAPTAGGSISRLITNTTSVKLGDHVTFKNIIGYSSAWHDVAYDQDGTPITYLKYISLYRRLKQYSWEPQLLGTSFDGALKWIVGAYYAVAHDRYSYFFDAFDLTPVVPPILITYDYQLNVYSRAVYAQGTYDLSALTGLKGLSLTVGGRYTKVNTDIVEYKNPNVVSGVVSLLGKNNSRPSWDIALQWQITHNLMTYITSRGSWRAGGINGFVPPIKQAIFEPENTHDVELGVKFQGTLGVPARINFDLFRQKVSNTQLLSFLIVNGAQSAFTVNAPNGSTVQGAEISADAEVLPRVLVGISYAFTDAYYGSPSDINEFGQSLRLGPYENAPRHMGSAYVQWRLPTPKAFGNLVLRVNTYYRSYMYFSAFNNIDPGTRLSPYMLVNGRLQWTDPNQPVSLAFYVRNATDRAYFTGGLPVGSQSGQNMALVGDPRTYGINLTWNF